VKSIITARVFGSADLWDAMHTNILPRTFSALTPRGSHLHVRQSAADGFDSLEVAGGGHRAKPHRNA
jgi:hypothetical protein